MLLQSDGQQSLSFTTAGQAQSCSAVQAWIRIGSCSEYPLCILS